MTVITMEQRHLNYYILWDYIVWYFNIRAAVLLSFLSKSFSLHSFSYSRVKISVLAIVRCARIFTNLTDHIAHYTRA